MTVDHERTGERLFSVEIGGVDGACLFWVGDSGGFLCIFPQSRMESVCSVLRLVVWMVLVFFGWATPVVFNCLSPQSTKNTYENPQAGHGVSISTPP